MAILGPIIKAALNIHEYFTHVDDHHKAQQRVLKELLEKATKTEFGKEYNFKEILKDKDMHEAFDNAIPYHDYHSMEEKWWSRLKNGEKDITWPGMPSYMARSSGTTGKKSKMIPVTDDMLDAISAAGTRQVSALTNFDLDADVFEKEALALGSSTRLEEVNGFKVGEISGIAASNIPEFLESKYRPGADIAAIDDWDKKVQTIAEKSADWDIAMISGIPSWLELMLKKVMEYHKVDSIHDVWPSLSVYTTGGVAFEPYRDSFEALFKKPVAIVDTYLASEGFIACQQRPESTAMQLITDGGIYFEFVPFKPEYILEDGSLRQDVVALDISQVEPDVDYVLIISTVGGAWRYLIGDTIAFTDVNHAEIKITGRTKFFLNVVGSQLSVLKMETALGELQEKYNTSIKEFTVYASKIDGEFHHKWFLETETETNEEDLADALDQKLQEANKNYSVARSKALKGVKVTKVPEGFFNQWNAHQKKMGGQVKMAKVLSDDKQEEWEAFVKEELGQ
ncbi:GH3 family domain-containing protein [Nonlabens marinus]|uniref:Putative auxin-regulated protein n=1 Tax=Nonlabens marinus S1-08 TaxID=1454201 RepID=W8VRL2_9FLAO|nr:GH3 auxin-responsive promoter family protein [Nonlabens marinus]BAO55680.1 putative auxin-regulated protein [Nonlabens marinus S1-08]